MQEVIAPCGLNCSQCDIHRAPDDPALMARIIVRLKKERGVTLSPYQIRCGTCLGDLVDHWSPKCDIRMCCVDVKHLRSCSHCLIFPCKTLTRWSTDSIPHAEAFERLKRLREEKF